MRVDATRADLSDHALLERFVGRTDEEAFAELVRRHGPMVRAACQRMLGDAHDADDAFQAVFLVLVRKAGSLRPERPLGPWLYGVAVRTARKALSRRHRRRSRERTVLPLPETPQRPEEPRDWLPLFDDALRSLPDKYRDPLVLCDLEGASRSEAAARLDVAEGTLSSRLARGRKLLRDRLERRGVAASEPVLVSELAAQAATSVPPSLVRATLGTSTSDSPPKGVAELADGDAPGIDWPRWLRIGAVALALLLCVGGAGYVAMTYLFKPSPAQVMLGDHQALQGDWDIGQMLLNGQDFAKGKKGMGAIGIKGDHLHIDRTRFMMKIDPLKAPKEMDLTGFGFVPNMPEQVMPCIYEIRGDELRIGMGTPNQPRPTRFDEPGVTVFVLKRKP